jgi:hypothetical protein
MEAVRPPSRALQLFEPPDDAVYTIAAAARLWWGAAADF